MHQACPISYELVDTNVIRIISSLVSALLLLFLFLKASVFVYILFFDMTIRVLKFNRFSPLLFVSKITQKIFKIKPKYEDAGAKRFALFLGLLFSAFLLLFVEFSLVNTTIVLTALFLVCALGEAIFGYCVGCKIYQLGTQSRPLFQN